MSLSRPGAELRLAAAGPGPRLRLRHGAGPGSGANSKNSLGEEHYIVACLGSRDQTYAKCNTTVGARMNSKRFHVHAAGAFDETAEQANAKFKTLGLQLDLGD